MSGPQISGIPHRDLLARIGTALLQIKCERKLTLDDMADAVGRSDDQVARYIAGDHEMGAVAWLRALEAWPELKDKMGSGK